MKNLINWIRKLYFPMKGKLVIRFITHGCMAQIEDFDFIGIIVGIVYFNNKKFYEIKILKNKNGYSITNNSDNKKHEIIYERVPSWYLHKLNNCLFVIYD